MLSVTFYHYLKLKFTRSYKPRPPKKSFGMDLVVMWHYCAVLTGPLPLRLCSRKPHPCRPYFQQFFIFWEEMWTHSIFRSLITTCHYTPIWHIDQYCLKIKKWSSSWNQYIIIHTNHWSSAGNVQLTSHTSQVTWLRGPKLGKINCIINNESHSGRQRSEDGSDLATNFEIFSFPDHY